MSLPGDMLRKVIRPFKRNPGGHKITEEKYVAREKYNDLFACYLALESLIETRKNEVDSSYLVIRQYTRELEKANLGIRRRNHKIKRLKQKIKELGDAKNFSSK